MERGRADRRSTWSHRCPWLSAVAAHRHAPNCEPCDAFDRVWAQLATNATFAQLGIRFGTVDCAVSPDLAARFQVRGYPSLR